MVQLTFEQAVELAARHYSAGEMGPAGRLCRLVLEQNPRHAEALQLLGLVEMQCGRAQAAVELMERGAESAPESVGCQRNLAEVYRAVRRLDAAAGELGREVTGRL